MDIASALKPDVFRAFAIYICPGVTAVAPWLYGVVWPNGLWRLVSGSGALASVAILAFCGLTAGLILENIGSRIELHIDQKLDKDPAATGVSRLFWLYLKTPCSPCIVADKFLSATITRFKFELSMIPALFVAAVAFVKMTLENLPGIERPYIAMAGLCMLGLVYLCREAHDSARLLHRLREQILFVHDQEVALGRRSPLDTSNSTPTGPTIVCSPKSGETTGEA